MINTTLILMECENPHFGKMKIQTEEHFPTPERALEIYKNYLKETPLGKEHPEYIEESTFDKPIVIESIILNEEKILELI